MGGKAWPHLTARALKARLVSSFRMSDFVVRMYTNEDLLIYELRISGDEVLNQAAAPHR